MSSNVNQIFVHEIVDMIRFTPRQKAICIQGPPGVGKTHCVYQYAEQVGDELHEESMVNALPEDTKGILRPNAEGNAVTMLSPDWWIRFSYDPRNGEKPDEKLMATLAFDEVFSAPMAVQVCIQKVAQERMLNGRILHPNVRVILMGNRKQDKANVTEPPLPLRSKMTMYEVVPFLGEGYPHSTKQKGWIHTYAMPKGIHEDVIAFLRMESDKFMYDDIAKFPQAYPCARAWETVSDYLHNADEMQKKGDRIPDAILEKQVAGAISVGIASEFFGWREIKQSCPTIEEIKKNPKGAKHSDEPSFQYAVTTMISRAIQQDSKIIGPCLQYATRNPKELQMMLVFDVVHSGKSQKTAMQKFLKTKEGKGYLELVKDMLTWED